MSEECLPDAATIQDAHDAIACEFAPATGYHWDGQDLARMSRKALIEALCTFDHKQVVREQEPRESLIYRVLLLGKMIGAYP